MTVKLKYCLGRSFRVNSEREEWSNRKQTTGKETVTKKQLKEGMEEVNKRRVWERKAYT
jgi:hypothetical protein